MTLYRLSGYTSTGTWTSEEGDDTALQTVRDGKPYKTVHTWVSVERWVEGEWVNLDD